MPRRVKLYKILKAGEIIRSPIPGEYAGWRQGKLFGRLDCESGERKMFPENRVFFHSLEDAVREGYRPCRLCRPMSGHDWSQLKHLIPESTLEAYYMRPRNSFKRLKEFYDSLDKPDWV